MHANDSDHRRVLVDCDAPLRLSQTVTCLNSLARIHPHFLLVSCRYCLGVPSSICNQATEKSRVSYGGISPDATCV